MTTESENPPKTDNGRTTLLKKAQAEYSKPQGVKDTFRPDIDEQAHNFESSRIQMMASSESRAWKITWVFGVLFIASAVSMIAMLPLKETSPYLVRVDNATGVTDIVSLITDTPVDYQDVQDKYWINKFIRAREGYNWYSLQSDYDLIPQLVDNAVALEYAKLFEGKDALHKKWKNKYQAEITILNISPNGKGAASVRFVKTVKVTATGQLHQPASYWVATVNYEYRSTEKMKESQRLINPFGFKVVAYRVDPEMGVSQ